MHCSYFYGRINVEKTSEQCCLGYHNSQKTKEGVWWDKHLGEGSNDRQVQDQDDPEEDI